MNFEPSARKETVREETAPEMAVLAAGGADSFEDLQYYLQIYSNRLAKACQENADWQKLGFLHAQLAHLQDALERYEAAERHYRAAVHCMATENLPQQEAHLRLSLGEIQAYLGNTAEALATFEAALGLAEQLEDAGLQAQALYRRGLLKETGAQWEAALADYQQAEEHLSVTSGAESLRTNLLAGMLRVQTEMAAKQALDLAEQLNRSFEEAFEASPFDLELPPSAPVPRSQGGELPRELEASRTSRPFWRPVGRRWP